MNRLLLVWLAVHCCALPGVAQGKLSRVRENVRPEKEEKKARKKSKPTKRRPRRRHCPAPTGDSQGFVYFEQGPDYGAAAPVIIRRDVLPSSFAPVVIEENPQENFFTRHPYAHPDGYVVSRSPTDATTEPGLRRWAARVSFENGNDFQGLNRSRIKVRIDSASGIGFQSRFNFFTEDLGWRRTDELFMNATEVLLHLAAEEELFFYLGAGFRVLSDDYATNFGLNVALGADIFPGGPFVFSFVIDGGTLGEAKVFHGRATLGIMIKRFEIYTGFDYTNIGGVSLWGPLLGGRLWF